jgi:ABC transporter with metal-binding/Fe-S-binding domain ATP-binding protein
MRLASLFTGGKDSTYATHLAVDRGDDVAYLVTMMPRRDDSWMFHTTNVRHASSIAMAIGIEHIAAETSGEKEKELEDLKGTLERLDVDGVVTGAIASTYQRSRIDRICEDLGLDHIAPLWGRSGPGLLLEMISAGMAIIVVEVAARGLDRRWLGRSLDLEAVDELVDLNRRYGVDVCGDGGEMETLVLDAPWFRSRLEVRRDKVHWDGERGRYVVEEATLVEKALPRKG